MKYNCQDRDQTWMWYAWWCQWRVLESSIVMKCVHILRGMYFGVFNILHDSNSICRTFIEGVFASWRERWCLFRACFPACSLWLHKRTYKSWLVRATSHKHRYCHLLFNSGMFESFAKKRVPWLLLNYLNFTARWPTLPVLTQVRLSWAEFCENFEYRSGLWLPDPGAELAALKHQFVHKTTVSRPPGGTHDSGNMSGIYAKLGVGQNTFSGMFGNLWPTSGGVWMNSGNKFFWFKENIRLLNLWTLGKIWN